jgi:hypothetical protein
MHYWSSNFECTPREKKLMSFQYYEIRLSEKTFAFRKVIRGQSSPLVIGPWFFQAMVFICREHAEYNRYQNSLDIL